jgi:hypothetical protein
LQGTRRGAYHGAAAQRLKRNDREVRNDENKF